MAENDLQPPLLGISWDGTGYGPDGTIWGGEFLHITEAEFERVAHLRTFCLPGGEMAVKEPRRAALGLLYEMFGDELFQMPDLLPLRSFSSREIEILKSMLARNLNSPRTSSAGRLFDAVAAIIGLRQITKFEGQAAMMLEFALENFKTNESYPLQLVGSGTHEVTNRSSIFEPPSSIVVDWQPMMSQILMELAEGIPVGLISAKFHNTLVEIMLEVARRIGEERVVLTGGCFQNKYLTERAVRRLREEGFRLYWHQRVPPNDGGIALGQVVAAAWELEFFRGLGHSEERSDEKSPDLMHRITPKLSLTESK
jgi:hydrogenase maturation protein HypF